MPRPGSVYSLHPSFVLEETSLANLTERTGKGLNQWIALLKKNGPVDLKEARDWLKNQRPAITTNYQWWITERAMGKGSPDQYDPDAYVDAMFEKKPGIRPLYEALLNEVFKLGSDIKVCPCQTMVPVFRNHVFAQFKPSTKTRLDLGFCLRGLTDLPARLIDTGGLAKGDRITHRIAIARLSDIDAEADYCMNKTYHLDT